MAKDNFSRQSAQYLQYRPDYPDELIIYILSLTSGRQTAWDCGSGNGQLAIKLANYFDKVYATDMSENQIKNAKRRTNIFYKIQKAEQTAFPNEIFDLVTVAQAIHWFDFHKFYQEVYRTLKSEGLFAVVGYSLVRIDPVVDNIIENFYRNVVGKYWDEERKYVDEGYQTIPFPFNEITAPSFVKKDRWNLERFIGYLNTWSAATRYAGRYKTSPVDLIADPLKKAWGKNETKEIVFPLLLRIGKKK